MTSDFDIFWAAWPNRKAKFAAMEAYVKARKVASAADILAGVEAYKRHLPDDPQFICRATTFLNQGRWMDEYDEPSAPPSAREDWFSECAQRHGGSCGGSLKHQHQMILDRRKAEAS